jgi:hypothetical protein
MDSRLGILALVALVALAVGTPIFRIARVWARRSATARVVMIAGSLGVVAYGVSLWSWIGRLEPPFSESPSGLFVVVGRATVVGLGVVAAVATLLGAAFAGSPRPGGRER